MTPFKFRRRQFLSEAVRVKRKDRGHCILKWMDRWPRVPFIWSDEKVFTIEQDFNHRNDKVLAVRVEDIPLEQRTAYRRQNPASVMVWAAVSSDGRKSLLIFIDKGVKINQEVYKEMLNTEVLPWL